MGDVKFHPVINDYKVFFEIKNINAKSKAKFQEFAKILKYPELIKCWYESGHAIVGGMLFKTGYSDVEYSNYIWAKFENYCVIKEKPGSSSNPELSKIGSDLSLFSWIKNRWSGEWRTPSEFKTGRKMKGWLYCDDGAGEKADFIHVVKHCDMWMVSLIHVKAAKSDSASRKISVGAHDTVLSQAIKNLRCTHRKILAKDLKGRLDNSENKYCWQDGSERKPDDFINFLDRISGSRSTKFRVVVVQPHTCKSYYTAAKNSNKRKQLDVLLVSASNSVSSIGAEFFIIGADV